MIIDSKVFAVALILGATVSPAMADGYYGALDVGQTKAGDACNTNGLPVGLTLVGAGCKDTATLYRIAGGYQFTPMWGAEVSYGAYGKATMGTAPLFTPGIGILSTGDWQLSGIQVSGTGTFPLGDAFSLIGKLGIARTDLKFSGGGLSPQPPMTTTTKLAYGIGAQYELTKRVAVRAQYEDLGTIGDAITTGTSKVTLLSAGVVYKF